jgi:hypothetical protein
MAVSSGGTSIFLFILATFSYLTQIGIEMTSLSWIPVISLSLAIFLASLGIIPLPYVFVTELMPNKVKEFNFCNLFLMKNLVPGEKRRMHDLHVCSHISLLRRSEGKFNFSPSFF